MPGLGSSDRMPHAWKAGSQTSLLASQLAAMPGGGTAILSILRCPTAAPGPYERACLLADWMKVHKPGSKLIVLDANADIVAERDNFMSAFTGLHGSVIQYAPNAEVTQVDPVAHDAEITPMGQFQGDDGQPRPTPEGGTIITANSPPTPPKAAL